MTDRKFNQKDAMAVGAIVVAGGLAIAFVVYIVTLIMYGLAIQLLWNWFLAPEMGVETLRFGLASLIAFVIYTLTWRPIPKEEDQSKLSRIATQMLADPVKAMIAIFTLWVIHLIAS